MKRLSFLFAVILGACVMGTTTHAQFSSNPPDAVKTTNTTGIVSLGNGFGVALLGYGLPESNVNTGTSSNYTFFGTPMGQPSSSDTEVVGSSNQFYVVQSDRDGSGANLHADYFAYKVLSPVSDPTSLTIVRTFLARIETNNIGSPQAGSIAACGVDKNGNAVLRVDASSSPNGSASQQAMFAFNVETNATVVITQVMNNVALAGSLIVTQEGSGTMKYGSLGKNDGLLAGNKFGGGSWGTQYVGRVNLTGELNLGPHALHIATDNDRSAMAINDTAKVIAYWQKTDDETALGSGSDACTHLSVFYYTDSGGSFSIDTARGVAGSNSWAFGTRDGDSLSGNHINTNAMNFFGATPFNGPPQISINDNGEMAFPVSINCYVGNQFSNGTRNATITGILFKDANTGTFRKVVDNTDTSLFAPAKVPAPTDFWSSTNNVISDPVLDNRGNVFFTAGLTNFLIGGTNPVSDIALYKSTPNTYPNPTSWTTTVILSEGRSFVEPTSGDTNRILSILGAGVGGGSTAVVVPRTFGANSINRKPAQGACDDLGGVVLTATITNLTTGRRFDGVLYIASLSTGSSAPFRITSISRTGNNVNLVWNGQLGSNVVQVSSGVGGGSYSNNFVDLATVVVGCPPGPTNYTDVGGATSIPSRYYRIKRTP
jgi:hypothetical protein